MAKGRGCGRGEGCSKITIFFLQIFKKIHYTKKRINLEKNIFRKWGVVKGRGCVGGEDVWEGRGDGGGGRVDGDSRGRGVASLRSRMLQKQKKASEAIAMRRA